MNAIKWKVKGWYVRMQLGMLRRQLRGLQRKFFAQHRVRRARQLEFPFRG